MGLLRVMRCGNMKGKGFGVGKCFLCMKDFNVVKPHVEHIIHNALGGQLKCNHILCEDCGGKLNEKVDKKFLELFKPIYGRMNLRKDRDKNIKIKGQYYFNNKLVDVIFDGKNVYPKKPYYFENINEILVFCNKKVYKNFKKKLEKEFPFKKIIYKKIPISEVEFEVDINREIEEYKLGLLKMATEFAIFNNIKLSNFRKINNILLKKIKNDIEFVHFIPFGIIDKLIEIQKNDLSPYPFHKLMIFNINKKLIVYIELFSTFQEFIILDNNYTGENIYKCYMQKILKEEDYEISIDNRRYYKERNLYFEAIGIPLDEVEKRFEAYQEYCENNCLDRFQWEWKLIQEENRKRKYSTDCFDYIKRAVGMVINQINFFPIVYNNTTSKYLNERFFSNNCVVKEIKKIYKEEKFIEIIKNVSIFYHINQNLYQEEFIPFNFRKIFYRINKVNKEKKYYYIKTGRLNKISSFQKRYFNFKLEILENYIRANYYE